MRRVKEERGKDWRVAFWNVAGLHNKDECFWKSLKEWDVMVLSETWVEGRGWQKLKSKLPKGYVWAMQEARRKKRVGCDGIVRNVGGGERMAEVKK
ncbi:hypothetical protein X777_12282 [Ooceraea biroi]|uniref:Endonuclease/exonuclease/phosphatase domain-containing protein n=1 Tax=Ooceraea biroi TaxID=2015173 RepID=A0A026W0B3_OOCBI|nr:hypothetical protein X777_12282 [Ooceraea biroi]